MTSIYLLGHTTATPSHIFPLCSCLPVLHVATSFLNTTKLYPQPHSQPHPLILYASLPHLHLSLITTIPEYIFLYHINHISTFLLPYSQSYPATSPRHTSLNTHTHRYLLFSHTYRSSSSSSLSHISLPPHSTPHLPSLSLHLQRTHFLLSL